MAIMPYALWSSILIHFAPVPCVRLAAVLAIEGDAVEQQRHQEEQYLQRRSKRRREVALFPEKRFGRVDGRIDVDIFYFQRPTPQ